VIPAIDAAARPTPPNRFLTVSNLLSISRAMLAVPFAVVMLGGHEPSRLWGAVIMCVAALTDKFDGMLARKLNQVTEWGKILDPLADKFAVIVVAIVLLVLGNMPFWFLTALVVRDVLIFTGGMYVKSRKGVLLQSNEVGKWTVGIIALALFLMVMNAQTVLVDVAIAASTVLLTISFGLYLKRFLEVIKD
jgi:CDP-diacylglycerol--glycerol-3-phosphate 3-phosphatidyltransferase